MNVNICGKRWNLRFTPLRKTRGDVDRPDQPGKQIRIDSRLKGEERLEVIVHEILHAGGWHRAEEYVEQEARDIARILWRLGYRDTEG